MLVLVLGMPDYLAIISHLFGLGHKAILIFFAGPKTLEELPKVDG
jgi:hypothetical protein